MLICSNCSFKNPEIAKFCANCGSAFNKKGNKNILSYKTEKKIVIFVTTIVSLLIFALCIGIYQKNNERYGPDKIEKRPKPSKIEIDRRKEIVKNFSDEFVFDNINGYPIRFYLKGENYDNLVISSLGMTAEFYQDFVRKDNIKNRLRREGFTSITFDFGSYQIDYNL